jgi:hypothetical protein
MQVNFPFHHGSTSSSKKDDRGTVMISRVASASRQSVITKPVKLAIQHDRLAIETLFRQFIDDQESILFVHYFGLKGL